MVTYTLQIQSDICSDAAPEIFRDKYDRVIHYTTRKMATDRANASKHLLQEGQKIKIAKFFNRIALLK